MKPSITRTIEFQKDISGLVIADALKDIATEMEGKYFIELFSDHDGVRNVTLGIVGKDYSGDVMLTHNSSVAFNLAENYRTVRVDSTSWNQQRYESEPKSYDGARIITVVELVQRRLKNILNIEDVVG